MNRGSVSKRDSVDFHKQLMTNLQCRKFSLYFLQQEILFLLIPFQRKKDEENTSTTRNVNRHTNFFDGV